MCWFFPRKLPRRCLPPAVGRSFERPYNWALLEPEKLELHNAGYGGLVELGSPRFAVDFRRFVFFGEVGWLGRGRWGASGAVRSFWEGLGGWVRGWIWGVRFSLMTGSLWADEDCGGKAWTLNDGRSVDVEMDVFHDRFLDVKMVCICLHQKQDMLKMIEMNYMMYKRDMIGMIWVLMYYINWWDDGSGKTPPLRCEFVEIDSRLFEGPPIVQHSAFVRCTNLNGRFLPNLNGNEKRSIANLVYQKCCCSY